MHERNAHSLRFKLVTVKLNYRIAKHEIGLIQLWEVRVRRVKAQPKDTEVTCFNSSDCGGPEEIDK